MKDNEKLFFESEGKQIEANILFTCFLEETNRRYCVFIAPDPETGEKQVSAASDEETDDLNGKMIPVETEEEWDILQDYLDEYLEENDVDVDELLK